MNYCGDNCQPHFMNSGRCMNLHGHGYLSYQVDHDSGEFGNSVDLLYYLLVYCALKFLSYLSL